MGRTDFSDQFRGVTIRYKQSACVVINPITVDNFAVLLNCTPVDHAWLLPKAIRFSKLEPELFRLLLGPSGLN